MPSFRGSPKRQLHRWLNAERRRGTKRAAISAVDPKTFFFVILALRRKISSDGSTFRWVPFRYRSPFRRVALPTGRPPDGSPSLRASLAPLNVRRRMRLGRHCRAPPLAVQPSPAPTIRHGGEARRVGAGARRWGDLLASVASSAPVSEQTNLEDRGEIAARPVIPRERSFIDEPLAAW